MCPSRHHFNGLKSFFANVGPSQFKNTQNFAECEEQLLAALQNHEPSGAQDFRRVQLVTKVRLNLPQASGSHKTQNRRGDLAAN